MTIEYSTKDIRRTVLLNGANGILRQKLHVRPTRNLHGMSFWTKTAMYAGVAKSGMLKRERNKRRPITFELETDQSGRAIQREADGGVGAPAPQPAAPEVVNA